MGRIKYENFKKYALMLITNGTTVCSCCLYSKLTFTTDDNHDEYWLECSACHIGRHNAIFSRIKKSWEHRVSNDPQIKNRTHDIQCEWYDNTTQNTIDITKNLK